MADSDSEESETLSFQRNPEDAQATATNDENRNSPEGNTANITSCGSQAQAAQYITNGQRDYTNNDNITNSKNTTNSNNMTNSNNQSNSNNMTNSNNNTNSNNVTDRKNITYRNNNNNKTYIVNRSLPAAKVARKRKANPDAATRKPEKRGKMSPKETTPKKKTSRRDIEPVASTSGLPAANVARKRKANLDAATSKTEKRRKMSPKETTPKKKTSRTDIKPIASTSGLNSEVKKALGASVKITKFKKQPSKTPSRGPRVSKVKSKVKRTSSSQAVRGKPGKAKTRKATLKQRKPHATKKSRVNKRKGKKGGKK